MSKIIATPTPSIINENTVWILCYKGTPLEMPFVYRKELIPACEAFIAKRLRDGESIAEQVKQIVKDLDELEKHISDTAKDGKYHSKRLQDSMGEEDFHKFCQYWMTNIICGLKLKAFANDNENGHLFINSPK